MNEHERLKDPAFDRLVAADPAKHAPGFAGDVLRSKVDALIAGSGTRPLAEVRAPVEQAEDGVGHASGGRRPDRDTEPEPEHADELAVRRHRRRTPWLVAAAVAGIVAAGGGGYLAGQSGLDTQFTSAVGGTGSADMSQEEEQDDAGAPAPMTASDSGSGTESQAEGVQPLDARDELPSGTRIVFHAGAGLSDTPGTAEVRSAESSGGESLGSYPVVSEEEAVERLGDPRFAGAVLGGGSQPAQPGAEVPSPGGRIAWPVEDVTIVSANLTEARYTLPDGAVLLVPAYDLADAAGSRWTVLAVDEELLDLAP